MQNEQEEISEADYQAVKIIAIHNGGLITNDEIFSVIVRGYWKLGIIKDRLIAEGIIKQEQEDETE